MQVRKSDMALLQILTSFARHHPAERKKIVDPDAMEIPSERELTVLWRKFASNVSPHTEETISSPVIAC